MAHAVFGLANVFQGTVLSSFERHFEILAETTYRSRNNLTSWLNLEAFLVYHIFGLVQFVMALAQHCWSRRMLSYVLNYADSR